MAIPSVAFYSFLADGRTRYSEYTVFHNFTKALKNS
jgi:hypothetical protein